MNVDTEWKIPREKYQYWREDKFNWKLKKYVVNVWIGSIWFMIVYDGEISKNGYGFVISVLGAGILLVIKKE